MTAKKRRNSVFKSKGDIIFYICALAVPVAQFIIFYVVVNFNSVLFAFKNVDPAGNTINWTVDNFAAAFKLIFQKEGELGFALGNSLLMFVFNIVCGVGLGLLYSFYISKKMFMNKFFRVLLFLPSIVSASVMAGVFMYFVGEAVPDLSQKLFGTKVLGLLDSNDTTAFFTLVFYNVLIGFGTSVLMYSNAMSAISTEIYDAAKIDGAEGIKEFWHISLPMIYSTLSTYLIAGVAVIFTNQMNLYSFKSTQAGSRLYTFGYYIYKESAEGLVDGFTYYPTIASIGLILTFISVPLTLGVKKLLEKFGPSEDR